MDLSVHVQTNNVDLNDLERSSSKNVRNSKICGLNKKWKGRQVKEIFLPCACDKSLSWFLSSLNVAPSFFGVKKTGISNVNARERNGTLCPVFSYKMGVISGESGGWGT